jgi:Cft2 family RNA processing exonuclease
VNFVILYIQCLINSTHCINHRGAVDDELEIKAYYAGHVLGAAMFHVKVGQQSMVYTVGIVC